MKAKSRNIHSDNWSTNIALICHTDRRLRTLTPHATGDVLLLGADCVSIESRCGELGVSRPLLDMADDLRPAICAEILSALTYGLRFDRRSKLTRRHSEMMAQFMAEALADMLDASNLVLMMKPPTPSVDVRPGSKQKLR